MNPQEEYDLQKERMSRLMKNISINLADYYVTDLENYSTLIEEIYEVEELIIELRQWRMSRFVFSERAWEDYLYWQTQDKKPLKRINKLLKDLERNGNNGIGKSESLKYRKGKVLLSLIR